MPAGKHLPRDDRIDTASLPRTSKQWGLSCGTGVDGEHREAQKANGCKTNRYGAIALCRTGFPKKGRSRQDRQVASHDCPNRTRTVQPRGAIQLCDGSAVDGANQNVSNGVHGCKTDEQCRPSGSNSTSHQDCSEEKESPLHVERNVHHVRQRRVGHATMEGAGRGHPEITDVVVGVAVTRTKVRGRNGFEGEVRAPRGNPERGCGYGAPTSRGEVRRSAVVDRNSPLSLSVPESYAWVSGCTPNYVENGVAHGEV